MPPPRATASSTATSAAAITAWAGTSTRSSAIPTPRSSPSATSTPSGSSGAKAKVDGHYGEQFGKDYKGCTAYGDFRDLINRKDIDVVGIATPDHWHVIPAIMAAKAGKDVIGEKPLTLTVAEGRILSDVMKQTGRIFQTASENRSIDVYIRLGRAGPRRRDRQAQAHRGAAADREQQHRASATTAKDCSTCVRREEPPKTLNYEMWLGQAPWMPYIPARLHGNFRWNLAFSGGVITDWGAHLVDLAQWGHDTEHTGPVDGRGQGRFSAARRRLQHGPHLRGPLQVCRRRDA